MAQRLSGIEEAGTLRTMFATAHLLAVDLREIGKVETALRSLVAGITIKSDCMEIILKPDALGIDADANWTWTLPLPTRRPFREARIRIDSDAIEALASNDLLALVADAMVAQRLVLASPELSLAKLAKREGRCRTQLTRLLRLSWMSPRIVDAIADGTQPKGLTRRALLICDMPVDWAEQERQFGFAA
jgi:site-specific DNA recombinase